MNPILLALAMRPALALSPIDASMILQLEAQRLPPLALATYVDSEDAETRARAARALGRLRTGGAMSPLRRMAVDADSDVRMEAVHALGQTPGAGRTLLDLLPAEQDATVRAGICEALGKQGESDATPALLAALGEPSGLLRPSPVPTAAAIALGRMALREVDGTTSPEVVSRLLDALDRSDRALRRGASFALARMRLTAIEPTAQARLFDAAKTEHDAVTQAFLVRATSTLVGAGAAQARLYQRTAADPSVGVRVATARAGGSAGWRGVRKMLKDDALGVRLQAIAAVGQVKTLDQAGLLLPIVQSGANLDAAEDFRNLGDTRLHEAAAALRALGAADRLTDAARWTRSELPTQIRVAAIASLTDPDALAALAADDSEAGVRTAAAMALASLDDVDAAEDRLPALLSGSDSAVGEIAASWLAEHPTKGTESALLKAVHREGAPELRREAALALVELYEGSVARVRRPHQDAQVSAQTLQADPNATVREAGKRLAQALDMEVRSDYHQLITVPLDELDRVRSARVRTRHGDVIIALYPEEAPVTVWNFVQLVEQGWYDGQQVHRVVPDFVVQDGDPRGDGMGGPGWSIPDEINPLHYERGTVGMALSGPDTGGSQWFVTLSPQPHLDGSYTVFGQVTRGMHVFERLQVGDRIESIDIERTPKPAPR